MSRSPRKLLRTAAMALDALREVWARHPDARADAVAALGEQRVAEIERAGGVIGEAADVMEDRPGGPAADAEPVRRSPRT